MEYIILFTLIILVLIAVFKTFQPSMDIVYIGTNRYRILLWYNSFQGDKIERKYIKLFN